MRLLITGFLLTLGLSNSLGQSDSLKGVNEYKKEFNLLNIIYLDYNKKIEVMLTEVKKLKPKRRLRKELKNRKSLFEEHLYVYKIYTEHFYERDQIEILKYNAIQLNKNMKMAIEFIDYLKNVKGELTN